MEATFTQTVELKHPSGIPSREGTEFEMMFHKQRRKRDDSTGPKRVKLVEGRGWDVEVSGEGVLAEMAARVKSLDYPTQKSLADAMGMSTGQISKLKAKAISQGYITKDCWIQCLASATELAEDGPEEALDF